MGILWKLQQDSLRRVVNLQVRKVDIHIDAGNLRGQSLNTVLLPARKKVEPFGSGFPASENSTASFTLESHRHTIPF